MIHSARRLLPGQLSYYSLEIANIPGFSATSGGALTAKA